MTTSTNVWATMRYKEQTILVEQRAELPVENFMDQRTGTLWDNNPKTPAEPKVLCKCIIGHSN